MMNSRILTTSLAVGLSLTASTALVADTSAPTAGKEKPAATENRQRIKEGVQVTELGCMRVFITYDQEAAVLKPRIEQAFSDVDFRIFPANKIVAAKPDGGLDMALVWKIDNLRQADLVFSASLKTTEKKALGNFKLYESVATVQLHNINSQELLATHTSRKTGARNVDAQVAKRSAREAAMDDAVSKIIAKSLGKAHKVLVHEIQLTGIDNERQLLGVMEYMGRLTGTYHVRRMWFDPKARHAGIEVIGAPQTATFWRAYLDQMPRPGKPATGSTRKTKVDVVPNKGLREKYPDWFAK